MAETVLVTGGSGFLAGWCMVGTGRSMVDLGIV
jgi:hypothetical protein